MTVSTAADRTKPIKDLQTHQDANTATVYADREVLPRLNGDTLKDWSIELARDGLLVLYLNSVRLCIFVAALVGLRGRNMISI